jgi:hypothetical protein
LHEKFFQPARAIFSDHILLVMKEDPRFP